MDKLTLRELAIPMIKSIDSFNYLLKSHHRRTAVIAYHIGMKMGLPKESLFNLVTAAALHDIGALSVQERNMLVQKDVENPKPHCVMGQRMLASFAPFKTISDIIKHHHIKYEDSLNMPEVEVPFESHIIHLADRIDILISPDEFILNQKQPVTAHIRDKVGAIFHPEVFDAFDAAAKSDIFWIEINNLEIEQLFKRIDFSANFVLTVDRVLDFALVMSRIIDFRSKFTVSHSYTVAHLAALIGSFLGFSEEKCKKLMAAGYLHDIGKIGIDPGIVEKNGALTDEEFNQMKLHTYYTGQILNELTTSEWFREIVTWAERHHEKPDGTGYPYALTDESLDDGMKVIAYSDVISALMEDRPYRKGGTMEEAFDIIRNSKLLGISPTIFGIIEEHSEEINAMVQNCREIKYQEYRMGIAGECSPA
ncbi:MAG: hypothetical protein H6R01_546 [Burkholderiaceae bacterium]|nr:hypothetical protein [Burkholderiaceae bacterium]